MSSLYPPDVAVKAARRQRFRGRWRQGNRFELLAESKRYLPAMLRAVDQAQTSILLELYLMESGRLATRVIAALCRASRRGVTVWLLLDGLGSMGLKAQDRRRLQDAGVALRFFNPLAWQRLGKNLSRDHRKLLVVDEQVAFTGGFGAVDEFLDDWYEIAVRIEGPVVGDWIRLFVRLWYSGLTRGDPPPTPRRGAATTPFPTNNEHDMRGRLIWGKGYRYQAIRFSLQRQMARAHRRIWVCTPYFVPTRSLRRRLARAARRGVDVRLLLPGTTHDHPGVRYAGQRFYAPLLRSGVRIFEFQPAFIHAKFSLADDWVTLGSCNFDHWSLHWNLEANQEVLDAGFAAQVAALFEDNFALSQEIDWACWQRRPWWRRLRERVFGTLDAWITRLR